MANWGQDVFTGFSTVSAALPPSIRLMGGTFDTVTGATLASVSMRWAKLSPYVNGTLRVAVYQGGALNNPTGAILVEDMGTIVIGTAGNGDNIYTLNSPTNPALTSGAVTWIGFKTNDTSNIIFNLTQVSAPVVDFQTVRGRADIASMTGGTDETVAWPVTMDGTPTFANFWYPIYLTYNINPTPLTLSSGRGSPLQLVPSDGRGSPLVIR